MIIRKLISEIPLSPGDRVVTATQYRDLLFIITERGAIFQVRGEAHES
jgi:hypothetical protein